MGKNKENKQYLIGEFSKIVKLSRKTLRYYDSIGLLHPLRRSKVNQYRYYNDKCVEKAYAIKKLRDLDFSIDEIKTIFSKCKTNKQIISFLKKKTNEIHKLIDKYQIILNLLITYQCYEAKKAFPHKHKISKKNVKDQLVAAIRFQGQYDEMPKYFLTLAKAVGHSIVSGVISMNYGKVAENIYDLEILLPVSQPINKGSIKSRILKGGNAIIYYHYGSYDTIAESYEILRNYQKKHNLKLQGPPREIVIKGPFTILSHSPHKTITEIQFLI